MSYRTSDKNYLKSVHESIVGVADDGDYCWLFSKKYLYLDDLHSYAVQMAQGLPVERGIGNLNSKIVFVLSSLEQDKTLIELFKKIFKPLNMDFNAFYFTSFNKFPGTNDILSSIIVTEMKNISPDIIFSVGDYGIASAIVIDKELLLKIDNLMKLDEKGKITLEQKIEMKDCKKELWDKIKIMIKYYED